MPMILRTPLHIFFMHLLSPLPRSERPVELVIRRVYFLVCLAVGNGAGLSASVRRYAITLARSWVSLMPAYGIFVPGTWALGAKRKLSSSSYDHGLIFMTSIAVE